MAAEVEKTISTAQLREISSFDDALALMRDTYGEKGVQLASDALGDGFAMCEDKDKLCGVALAFVSWAFVEGTDERSIGENGYVVARAIDERGTKWIVVDGSTGVNMQLRDYTAQFDRTGGLVVQKGLRRSDYTTEIPDKNGVPKPTKATTYYIDTAAAA